MEFRDVEIMGAPEGVPEIERLIPRIPGEKEEANLRSQVDELVDRFTESLSVFEKLKREDRLKVKNDFLERIDNVYKISKHGDPEWEKKRKKLLAIREQVVRYS